MNNPINLQNETFGQSESTQAFAKLPKVFFDEKAPQYLQYKHLTAQHILAYTLMRDRLQLSISNQMKDKDGTPFIYYDLENIAAAVRCRAKKAGKLVDELDNVGLIRKVRQGLGKPNLIYVYDVLQANPSNRQFKTSPADSSRPVEQTDKTSRNDSPDPSNGQFKSSRTDWSRTVELTVPDQSSGQSNKTDNNKTEISKTDNSKTKINKTDNSNYSVDGNERAFGLGGLDGILTSNAKDYLLARNEESLVDEVRQLLFQLVRLPHSTIRIDDQEMSGNAVSERLKNISIKQIETALNRVAAGKCSEEQREDCLTAELYHVTQENSDQTVQAGITDSSYQTASQTSSTDNLANIDKEAQERNKKTLDQMCAEMSDFWSKPCSFTD